MSINHIAAGFTGGFHYRRHLRRLLETTPRNNGIVLLEPEALRASGIVALALDFDGVLACHGFPEPYPETIAWLTRCQTVFGGDTIFILSNKPTDARIRWFAEHFPAIRLISGVRKKPYPDGLIKTGELAGVPLSSILMVDDRLLTGCLAALIAGAVPCYISRPFASYRYRPVAELFFALLRRLERTYITTVSLL